MRFRIVIKASCCGHFKKSRFYTRKHFYQWFSTKIIQRMCNIVKISVANPDPDPVFLGHLDPGSGFGSGKMPDPEPLSTKKNLVILIFSLYKIVLNTFSSK